MKKWVWNLYIAILKNERKVSGMIITRHGNIFHINLKIRGDMEIQEWINKLQDR